MVAVVHGLLAMALLFGAIRDKGQQANAGGGQAQTETVDLTNKHPEVSFAVSPDTLADSPHVLALSFTRVINPAGIPFVIFVYLSYRPAEKPGKAPIRILLGNGSLFPADRPGGFRLRTSNAFAKLKADKATDVRLVLEMKRLHPSQPWSQVEVTVASPQWRSENTVQGERVSK